MAARGAKGSSIPFRGLLVFTFILFVAPQTFIPALYAFRISLVTAGFALAVYVLERLSRGGSLSVTPPSVRLLFGFTALAAASIPFSRWPGGALDVLTDELLKSLLIFVLVANTVDTLRRMKLLIGSMTLWSVLMSWSALRDFSAGKFDPRGLRIHGYDSPLAGNPNDLALILNLILALVAGLYLGTRKSFKKSVLLAVMGLLAAAVIATFSRGGFLTLITIALLILIRRAREGVGGVAFLLAVLLVVALLLPQGYGARVSTIFEPDADATGSATARWDTMGFAFRMMLEHPLLGLGLGMHGLGFLDVLGDWTWTGVHNVYLQIGADLGVPALVVYVLAVWQLFKGLRQPRKWLRGVPAARELLAAGVGIEIALAAFLVGGFFHPVAYHFYFFYVAGLAVAFQQIASRVLSDGPAGEATGRVLGHAFRT